MLSPDLLAQFDDARLLHALATNSSKVLPHGKTLTSAFMGSWNESAKKEDSERKALEERVGNIVKRAFWDEALEALSSPLPPIQLQRLQLLYKDLHGALIPLLPPTEPLLVTFSSPISPTSAPIQSALRHLRSTLVLLRSRCAPLRDGTIDEIIEILDTRSDAKPKILIDAISATLELTEVMRSDLRDFAVSRLSEHELKEWIKVEAKEKERLCILGSYGGLEGVIREWDGWLDSGTLPKIGSKSRILQVVSSNVAASFPYPTLAIPVTPNQNLLPPPLGFSLPDILHMQNVLQALIIAAALRTLVTVQSKGDDFVERVWTLLATEVDNDSTGPLETNIMHLGDEVIRAWRRSQPVSDMNEEEPLLMEAAEIERKLRAAVNRILRVEDPVWGLLQRRITDGFLARLTQFEESGHQPAPLYMQTGFRVDKSRRNFEPAEKSVPSIIVRGFEDPILKKALTDLFEGFCNVIRWLEWVWPDVVGSLPGIKDGI